jgi:hypothetical protein
VDHTDLGPCSDAKRGGRRRRGSETKAESKVQVQYIERVTIIGIMSFTILHTHNTQHNLPFLEYLPSSNAFLSY